jgi:hypothetical protein
LATDLAAKFGDGIHPVRMWKRFLDDIFIIWTGTLDKLHEFLDALNKMHPTIKFTMNHTKMENENIAPQFPFWIPQPVLRTPKLC